MSDFFEHVLRTEEQERERKFQDELVTLLESENAALRAANAIAVAKATQASLELDELARVRARLQVQREAFARLAEVASAVYALIPEDARKDRDGDAIVACGLTMPQLIRALAERAQSPREQP